MWWGVVAVVCGGVLLTLAVVCGGGAHFGGNVQWRWVCGGVLWRWYVVGCCGGGVWWGDVAVACGGVLWRWVCGGVQCVFSSKRFASMFCASGLLQDSDIDEVCQVRCTLRMQCLGVATARNQGTGCAQRWHADRR